MIQYNTTQYTCQWAILIAWSLPQTQTAGLVMSILNMSSSNLSQSHILSLLCDSSKCTKPKCLLNTKIYKKVITKTAVTENGNQFEGEINSVLQKKRPFWGLSIFMQHNMQKVTNWLWYYLLMDWTWLKQKNDFWYWSFVDSLCN